MLETCVPWLDITEELDISVMLDIANESAEKAELDLMALKPSVEYWISVEDALVVTTSEEMELIVSTVLDEDGVSVAVAKLVCSKLFAGMTTVPTVPVPVGSRV